MRTKKGFKLREVCGEKILLAEGVENIDFNSIYINSAGTDSSDLYPTLAHEGYPGHLYQTQYFASTSPSLIRNVIKPGGYIEGWASYVEVHSYEYAGDNTLLNSLVHHTVSLEFSSITMNLSLGERPV